MTTTPRSEVLIADKRPYATCPECGSRIRAKVGWSACGHEYTPLRCSSSLCDWNQVVDEQEWQQLDGYRVLPWTVVF